MLKPIKTVDYSYNKIDYSIEIDLLIEPVGDDVLCEIYLYKIKNSLEEYFTYKVRLTDRVLASVSHGLDNFDRKISLGLEETLDHIGQGIIDDLILTYSSFGWTMEVAEVSLVKHSDYYK